MKRINISVLLLAAVLILAGCGGKIRIPEWVSFGL